MSSEALRYRQVHLDFHTSEKIAGIGAKFDPKQFQEMLKRGHVDSITLFSKCHHGLSYHETSVGTRHPHLVTELLPRQMEACAAIDVRTPIYLSAGLDEVSVRAHPEWVVKDKKGGTFDPLAPGFKVLCFNTPYLDYLCAQIEEVVDKYDGGHGIFLDIIAARGCFCQWCLNDMEERGVDMDDGEAVHDFAHTVLQKYLARATAASLKGDPNRRVFHNFGSVSKGSHDIMKWNSHLELESLPTGGWGYDHFPLSAKYAATTKYDFLGMTGKFHTSWGEFGGFKRPEALRYECAAMLAFNSKCSIGDQLHPSGEMNPDTYALIGSTYADVEAREAWSAGAKTASEIALVSVESQRSVNPHLWHTSHADEGAARMLLELHVQFDVVDLEADLSTYKLAILPEGLVLKGAFLQKIKVFAKAGGKLLLGGSGGFAEGKDDFAFDFGLQVVGKSEFDPDYIVASAASPTPPVRGEFVIHGGAWNVVASPGAKTQVLATRSNPYFNRAWNHFCSHQHTPDEKPSEYPAVIAVSEGGQNGAVYFAHNIFTRYRDYGQPLYRDLVRDALGALLGEFSVTAALPSTARASLLKQENEKRYVLHLLHATPVMRGGSGGGNARAVEVIEDLTPLDNVACTVSVPETVTSVRLAPEGDELPFTRTDGRIAFTVPRVLCGQMVELAY